MNDLFHYYQNQDRAAYYIALDNDKVIGGVGFGPVTDSICELQKCYVKASERNQGVGQELLKHVINEAKRNGFKYMYLESSHLLQEAIPFYEKNGFRSLNKPLPNQQNHHAMDIWKLKEISKSC
uniref:GNAT family N-acetyltransferase n=1 Tax=Streptococcus uberis TaxID=1349 RepID=UPI0027DE548F|nr:GNAT family N-acetyltransferase [Streptococcus uberis]